MTIETKKDQNEKAIKITLAFIDIMGLDFFGERHNGTWSWMVIDYIAPTLQKTFGSDAYSHAEDYYDIAEVLNNKFIYNNKTEG